MQKGRRRTDAFKSRAKDNEGAQDDLDISRETKEDFETCALFCRALGEWDVAEGKAFGVPADLILSLSPTDQRQPRPEIRLGGGANARCELERRAGWLHRFQRL
ncbi:hypothetical protein [Rhizobium grahamii]|uniref:hypothetical protein n=1 Tax=Rhizobium grahamii TaxID=1120045 RepID=UPI00167327F4|nr:hypothetical protein [Rhizobium grahamii]